MREMIGSQRSKGKDQKYRLKVERKNRGKDGCGYMAERSRPFPTVEVSGLYGQSPFGDSP